MAAQDVKLTAIQQLLPLGCWNPLNQQPIWSWLEEERHHTSTERMKQCGNLVVPEQAARAFTVLLHVTQMHSN